MCTVPFAIPNFGNFTETFGIDAHLIQETSIESYCGQMSIGPSFHSAIVSASNGVGMGNLSTRAMLRMFQNPVGAVASLRNLGMAFGSQNMTTRTVHAACAISRLNAVLWTISYLIVLACIYLACCWPCTNIVTLLMRFFCCCFFWGHFCKKNRIGRRGRRPNHPLPGMRMDDISATPYGQTARIRKGGRRMGAVQGEDAVLGSVPEKGDVEEVKSGKFTMPLVLDGV